MNDVAVTMRLNHTLEIVRLTDIGRQREHNEDAVASDDELGFVVLADGMGGYKAGEVASEMAVLCIASELQEAKENLLQVTLDPVLGLQEDAQLLFRVVRNANEAIYNVSQSYPQCAGMGTTLAVAMFTHDKLLVGHIGDSRMYRLRQHVLAQITEDHSLIQEQIRAGLMTAEQARHSANKNLVTRALGVDPIVDLELNEHVVEVDDIYLLCSDGLSDLVDDGLIQSTLNMLSSNLEKAAQMLVQLANDSGGTDNISVILVKVKAPFTQKVSWFNAIGVDNFLGWIK